MRETEMMQDGNTKGYFGRFKGMFGTAMSYVAAPTNSDNQKVVSLDKNE